MGCEIEKTIWSHAYITSPGLHHLTLRFNYGALVFSPVGDSWSTITLLNYIYSIQLSNESES